MGNVSLRVDCARLDAAATADLAGQLGMFLKVQVVGGDLIFASGKITSSAYANVWIILRHYDVDID